MHGRTDGRTDNVKTVYPLQTKFAGGIIRLSWVFQEYDQSQVFVLHIWTCLQGLMQIQQWLFELLRKKHYIKSHLELQREITLIELAPSPYFFV